MFYIIKLSWILTLCKQVDAINNSTNLRTMLILGHTAFSSVHIELLFNVRKFIIELLTKNLITRLAKDTMLFMIMLIFNFHHHKSSPVYI